MNHRTYRRTTRYILLGIAVMAGLALARKTGEISGWWPVLLGFLCLVNFRKSRLLSVYLVILFGLSLGLWRGGQFMREVRFLGTISKENVVLIGTAQNDSLYDDKGAVSFDLGSLELVSPEGQNIVGKVGVSGHGERMVYRGDRVRVEGKFYPGRGSYTAWLNYADMQVVSRSQSAVFKVTREFSAGMQTALPEPQASFGLGILIGQRDTLPESTSDMLAMVGLTHIIAVSGYNLTILVRSTRRLLAKRSKFQATVAALVLIGSFLLVTGASPSIVRASIISTLALGAWYFGRNVRPMVLISLVAAGTAVWNPLYLWSDIGWYLSFLAFFGVLVLAPLFRHHVLKNKQRGFLGEVLIETTAAQVMTLPIILYIFNDSSLVALLANLLVVPLIPLGMLFSFVAGLAGMLIPALAGWFAWPAKLMLTYLLDAAGLVARIPNMAFSVTISTVTMLLMYGLILMLIIVWWRRASKTDKITDIQESNVVI